jgi:predicted transcriptional regulator
MKDENKQHHDGTVADGGTESFDDKRNEPDRMEKGVPKEEISETTPEARRDFLLEAVRRAPLLRSLRSESADAGDLAESVDMSRSTIHRATNSLENYNIVEETNGTYELTGLGEVIAEEIETFSTRACTALSLKQYLNSIDMNGNGIPVEYFIDAKITRRKSRQPHATLHRIIELIESSDSLQMFSTVLSPVYVDVGYREMMNGTKIEAIFDREAIDIMLSEYPEKAHETIATGNFDVYTHDGLPFELFILDDKIGMAAHNENGTAEVLVECDDPLAIEWAEDLYAKHLSKADSLTLSDL